MYCFSFARLFRLAQRLNLVVVLSCSFASVFIFLLDDGSVSYFLVLLSILYSTHHNPANQDIMVAIDVQT